MAGIKLGGIAVISLHATDALFNRAVFDIDLASSLEDARLAVGNTARLELADGVTWDALSVLGASDRNGRVSVRLAAGKSGTRLVVRPKAYEGATWRQILEDAIRDAGESAGRLEVAGGTQRYVRPGVTLGAILDDVCARFSKQTWRVERTGNVSVYAPSRTTNIARVLEFAAQTKCAVLDFTPDLEPGQVLKLPDGGGFVVNTCVHRVAPGVRKTLAWGAHV